MFALLQDNAELLLSAAVGISFVIVIVILLGNSRRSVRKKKVPPNTVLIYDVGRGPGAPSASPFPLKLETFCRMARIPYMVDHSHKMSSKGKTPWMEYNGQAVADSQFCIEYLKTERGLDLNADLSPSELAQARAFREMTEENLYWTMCYELFVKHPEKLSEVMLMSGLKLWVVKLVLGHVIKKELWGHGMGRHSDSEIWDIGRRDLNAIADYLGDKKFFCGDKPTEVDCAMFAMLGQILCHMKGSRHEQHVRENLPNIVEYFERMKARFWPDWEQRCRGENYVDDSYTVFEDHCTQSSPLDQEIQSRR